METESPGPAVRDKGAEAEGSVGGLTEAPGACYSVSERKTDA